MARTHTFFPDTTILINLGLINRLALLDMFDARYWGHTVAEECADQFQRHSIATYADTQRLFGTPLMPNQTERINTTVLRDNLAEPGDAPDAHMGEAETIILATSRDFARAVFLTDDGGARKAAASQGITVASTWDVIRAAVRKQRLTETDAWNDAKTLLHQRRTWPKGVGQTYAEFIAWLRA